VGAAAARNIPAAASVRRNEIANGFMVPVPPAADGCRNVPRASWSDLVGTSIALSTIAPRTKSGESDGSLATRFREGLGRLHRAPGAAGWEGWHLDRAMDRVAELVKKTRDETFIERLPDGKLVNMTPAIFSLGGATLDNEWNHIHQKLMRGVGIVAIENQARI